MPAKTLYYIMDPMCSWCYGFSAVLRQLVNALPPDVHLRYVMGGLAADADGPMPEETRRYVQEQWRLVRQRTGAAFNWDFWTECEPRRSTYPACRAVISAGRIAPEKIPPMAAAIQRAYYHEARNPSLNATLVELAAEIGIDADDFRALLADPQTDALLREDFALRDKLGVSSFPSLRLDNSTGAPVTIATDYKDFRVMLGQIV